MDEAQASWFGKNSFFIFHFNVTPTHTLGRLNAIFPVSLTSSVQMFGNIIAIPLVDRWLIHYSASVDYNNCTNDNDDGDDNGRDDYDDR